MRQAARKWHGGGWRRGLAAALVAAAVAGPAGAADVRYTVVDGLSVPAPISPAVPDPDRGGVIFLDPARGDCITCHRAAGLPDLRLDPRRAGPELDDVARRYSDGELRLIVINARLRWPKTIMPAFHNVSREIAIKDPGARQPILTAREVEDVIAFLKTLGE